MIKIAFAGNPNTGKSALINAIAGSRLQVGNWPGVTVEKKEAYFRYNGEDIALIDLPGVYSLSPYSIEEIITRDYIINENPDVIINVVDSTNLERNLYLTYLLQELDKPMVIALNLSDEFDKLDYNLDLQKFCELIGSKSVKVSAVKKTGLEELMKETLSIAKSGIKPNCKLPFLSDIIDALGKIQSKFEGCDKASEIEDKYGKKYLSIKFLENDIHILSQIKDKFGLDLDGKFDDMRRQIEENSGEDINSILAEARYGVLNGVLKQSFSTSIKSRLEFSEKIDKIFLNKFLGLPLFFVIIAGLMGLVFNGSAPLIDWVDSFFSGFVGDYVGKFVEGTPAWLSSLAVDGIVAGVGGVLTFVPLMTLLYFFLAILEESGYMNRVAFLMDKIMRKLGLNGKAFVPMVIGFGCSVPAIYATRTLEDEKSRKLTAAITPFMSCGARLPVYGLFTAAFFGTESGLIVVLLYLLGIVVAILAGLILKRFDAFKVDGRALLIELPPYRVPSLRVILSSTARRLMMYLKKASTVILGILIILWALGYFPSNGDIKESYIAKFGHALQPILAPTGFADRWEAAAAVVPSIAAKEVVVGFMAQILPMDNKASAEKKDAEEPTFMGALKDQGIALAGALKESVKGMLSFNVAGLFTVPDASEIEQDDGSGLINATKNLWTDNLAPLRAFSFMVFILLVVPCVVTLAALKQEFGWKFMWFMVAFMTVIPYIVSTLVFQIGRLLF